NGKGGPLPGTPVHRSLLTPYSFSSPKPFLNSQYSGPASSSGHSPWWTAPRHASGSGASHSASSECHGRSPSVSQGIGARSSSNIGPPPLAPPPGPLLNARLVPSGASRGWNGHRHAVAMTGPLASG